MKKHFMFSVGAACLAAVMVATTSVADVDQVTSVVAEAAAIMSDLDALAVDAQANLVATLGDKKATDAEKKKAQDKVKKANKATLAAEGAVARLIEAFKEKDSAGTANALRALKGVARNEGVNVGPKEKGVGGKKKAGDKKDKVPNIYANVSDSDMKLIVAQGNFDALVAATGSNLSVIDSSITPK